jgi:outer membrane lipoprotein-sorting protein
MFKFLLGTLVMTAPIVVAHTLHAQLPPAVPDTSTPSPSQPQPQPSVSPQPSVAPQPSTAPQPATSTEPDLTLLGKVLGAFLRTNKARTESQIVMKLQGKDGDVEIYARSKTVAKTSGEFRSELTFAQPGQPPTASYTIVSNGSKVWIYRPDRRQYSQTTAAKFQAQPYSYLVGLSTIFFLSVTEANRRDINAALAVSPSFLTSLPKEQMKDLQGSMRQVDGEELYAYSYENKTENWSFNSLVNPQTGIIKQIEFTGKLDAKDGGTNFTLTEKIIERNSQPTIANSLFKFSPPKGTKKVKSVDIDLIGR